MKKITLIFASAVCGLSLTTACIQEINPQSNTVTEDQAAAAPGVFDLYVDAITSTMTGQFGYGGTGNTYPYDYGYTSFYLMRDVMGQDIALASDGSWYQTWYCCGTGLGPRYAVCQMPWTYYYGWILNCNTVINMVGEEPAENQRAGVGIAYAMRALYYMELAQMFASKTYGEDPSAETVPLITGALDEDLTHNPRRPNSEMWAFIISDLDKAEELLQGYTRPNKTIPDVSVVYGLKARAYLVMCDWANAERYAKQAQAGYTMLNEAQYTSRANGFNSMDSQSSWMLATAFHDNDDCILMNDGDSSWGSIMCLEINPEVSGCGYASNYGYPMYIDRHLYETIPATDFRKKCFVDFAIDDMSEEEQVQALGAYSDHPDWVQATGNGGYAGCVGGLSLKFRVQAGGNDNQYVGFVVDVPMMRVEEMYLIEAEAAGMQDAARGEALLTAFAKTRDPNYTYGTHRDSYGNTSTSTFQNECWWQRRVEFWGERLATFDIKRLNKGIIRSYPNTNHLEGYRWNTNEPPAWMNLCIVETETMYNYDCTNNPTPIPPTTDSPEYQF